MAGDGVQTTPWQYHRLLRELDADYQGIVEDLDFDVVEEDQPEERIVDQPARELLRKSDVAPALFDYQADLVSQFESVCAAAAPANIALLALPTGAGKTRTAAVALLRVFSAGQAATALWLAPTRELLTQAADTTKAVWSAYRGAVDVELVRADRLARYPSDLRCGIMFATPQMVAARLRRGIVPDPDVVVFDEAHHVEAPVFRHALGELRERKRMAVIGLSATPGRTREKETERLVDFFQGRLLWSGKLKPNPIEVLQRRGVLAKVEFRNIPVPAGVACHAHFARRRHWRSTWTGFVH